MKVFRATESSKNCQKNGWPRLLLSLLACTAECAGDLRLLTAAERIKHMPSQYFFFFSISEWKLFKTDCLISVGVDPPARTAADFVVRGVVWRTQFSDIIHFSMLTVQPADYCVSGEGVNASATTTVNECYITGEMVCSLKAFSFFLIVSPNLLGRSRKTHATCPLQPAVCTYSAARWLTSEGFTELGSCPILRAALLFSDWIPGKSLRWYLHLYVFMYTCVYTYICTYI